jgi:hypothetical protein
MFNPADIDWSDPIEANRQLKAQLALLEQQQGGGGGGGSSGQARYAAGYDDEPAYDDENDERYQDEEVDDQYVSRSDYNPKYDDDYYRASAQPSEEAVRATQQYDKGHRGGGYSEDDRSHQQQSSGRRGGGSSSSLGRSKGNGRNTKNEGRIQRNPSKRDNMTFTGDKCRDIDRGNIALLQRLSTIHNRGGGGVPKPVSKKMRKKKGSASINMQRKQNKIAEENRKFANRLQRVRGTGSLSKSSLRKHAQRTAKFAELGREVRPVISKRQKARKDREERETRESGWQ